MSSESARRSDSLIVRYRKLNGEVGGAVLSELYWQPGRTNLPREERYWPGRRNQGEHLVFTYDDEWIVFRDDQGDEEPDAVDSARNRELSEREAVVWLEDNDHFLPSVLRGRSLAGQVRARTPRDSANVGAETVAVRTQQKGAEPSRRPERVWEADEQIRCTLEAVGQRLTTTELLSKMAAIYPGVSDSTVKKRLSLMVREKRLTNEQKIRPRGYGLPEWDSSFGS